MRIRRVLAEAWRMYARHFGDLLRGTVLQLAVCLMALAPLLFLTQAQTRPWALLCPALLLLIALPLRQNAAQAYAGLWAGKPFAAPGLLSLRGYGKKLGRGLWQGIKLLPFWLPALAMAAALLAAYNGLVDVLTLLRFFLSLGGGSFVRGLGVALGAFGAAAVLGLVGLALGAWRRHGYALGLPRDAARGRRGQLLLLGLAGAALWLPFLAAVAFIGRDYLLQLSAALSNLMSGTLTLPPLGARLWLVGAAFLALLVPLWPLKSLMVAAFAQGLAQGQAAGESAPQEAAQA